MGNGKEKLIFLDIDGTILIPGEGVRGTLREGFSRVRRNGHKLIINTGRSFGMLPQEVKEMEFDGIITSAGSDIWLDGKNVFREALDVSLLLKACALLEEVGAVYLLEEYEKVYLSGKGQELFLEQGIRPGDNPEIVRWKQFLRSRSNVVNIKEWDPHTVPIPKLTFKLWSGGDADRVKEELGDDFYVAFYFRETAEKYGMYNGELISRKEHKGTAIRRVAGFLHVDMEDTIAFGDSMNDYQMIEAAGCGVAMGNGDARLKAVADRVCEPVEEDGVLKELERMGLLEGQKK